MTPTDLDALIRLEAKATKGEHRVGEIPQNLHAVILDVSPGQIIELARFSFDHDAHLYAALRNAAPALLSELKESRETNARLNRRCQEAERAVAAQAAMLQTVEKLLAEQAVSTQEAKR